MRVRSVGPADARIMLIGEAPGEEEVYRGEPFIGASGAELNRMLHEAGISRSECFITNVCRERPPGNDLSLWVPTTKIAQAAFTHEVRGKKVDRRVAEGYADLMQELALVKPNVVVPLGNTALWAVTGKWGITAWRGSVLRADVGDPPPVVVPAYHPAAVLRQWSWRPIAVHDLRRAAAYRGTREIVSPNYAFIIRPNFATASTILANLLEVAAAAPLSLSVDIETRAGHIACLGIAWTELDALCIPFMCVERPEGYWHEEEEAALVWSLRKLLTHPNARIIGQNFSYDAQYIWRHWRFMPRFARDTMLAQHTLWAGMPKGLDFLSSLYCDHHVYWKDEGKEWHAALGEDQLWTYNCKDAVITFEVDRVLQGQVDAAGLREVHDFQQGMFWPVTRAMRRGIQVNAKRRSAFALKLSDEMAAREGWLKDVLGHPLNPRSPVQMKNLFYGDFGQRPFHNRKTGQVSLDEECLTKIAAREPLLRPLVRRILEHRSLGVFLGTFVGASPSWDGRMRSSFNLAGTETFRLSSSTDAFGSGMNLQNIPKGGPTGDDPFALELPNVRELFTPDPGYTFFDLDLDRADLQVVVWEAEDDELKAMLREGADLHTENARVLGISRQLAKSWVHGTNYGGGPRTMAVVCGISVHQAERMRARWFEAHPGIARWHRRVESTLQHTRTVTNRFGYRRTYFDRIEGLLPEALAWVPQSTVACIINRVWMRLALESAVVEVLLQVHDSLAGQFPTRAAEAALADLRTCSQIVVPYDDPLVIPVGVKTSAESWGACA